MINHNPYFEQIDIVPQGKFSMKPVEERIRNIIQEHLQPKIRVDGGDIEFEKLDGTAIYLGAYAECATCPASPERLQWWCERELQKFLDTPHSVVIINRIPYFER
jgi:Fe-S cluster biogenesis protein NfuA